MCVGVCIKEMAILKRTILLTVLLLCLHYQGSFLSEKWKDGIAWPYFCMGNSFALCLLFWYRLFCISAKKNSSSLFQVSLLPYTLALLSGEVCMFTGHIHLLRLREVGPTEEGWFYLWVPIPRRSGLELSLCCVCELEEICLVQGRTLLNHKLANAGHLDMKTAEWGWHFRICDWLSKDLKRLHRPPTPPHRAWQIWLVQQLAQCQSGTCFSAALLWPSKNKVSCVHTAPLHSWSLLPVFPHWYIMMLLRR